MNAHHMNSSIKRLNITACAIGMTKFIIPILYSPLEPFFDKSWRPSEVELVK